VSKVFAVADIGTVFRVPRSGGLPELPKRGAPITVADVERIEAGVIEQLTQVTDIGEADEWRRKAKGIEAYLRSPELQKPMLGAQRRIEAKIGQLLGPAVVGANQHNQNGAFTHEERLISRAADRHDFRVLAKALEQPRLLSPKEWRQSRRALVSLLGTPVNFDGALPSKCQLFNCSLVDAEIESDSIDWIVTDPPYPKEFISLYADLAKMAQRWLRPGGSLLAMSGQTYMPEVLTALMSTGLLYQWTLAYLTPGGQAAQIFPKKVNTFWKPVFWLVKGQYQGSWIGDVVKSKVNDNDKRFHDWGQSESGFADLIERFAKVGDTICDPFMGGGTTGVVSLARGMSFVGVEKDTDTFNLAKARLSGIKGMVE
jgi:16S rRNA G966 N2-methylase RsmD